MEIRCPSCDRPVVEGAIYCTGCGVKLQEVCQSCNTPASFGSAFCSVCGSRLSGATTASAATRETLGNGPAVSASCPRCRKVNEPGAAFCFSCGLPLDEEIRPPAETVSTGVPAGFWIRVVALFIDGIVLLVLAVVIFGILFTLLVENPTSEDDSLGWINYAYYLIQASYFTIAVAAWSATLGKRAVGIYVLRPDGSRVGLGRAFARWLASILSALLLFIGYLMVGLREDKRGLHDLICDTVVVYKR